MRGIITNLCSFTSGFPLVWLFIHLLTPQLSKKPPRDEKNEGTKVNRKLFHASDSEKDGFHLYKYFLSAVRFTTTSRVFVVVERG